MRVHNRRHSCGTLLPNIFFILQVIGIVFLFYAALQITPLFMQAHFIVYPLTIIATMMIGYCLVTRSIVIHRQNWPCKLD